MSMFLLGGITVACTVASLFFLRFWRGTGDRFFLWFALSFLVEAANRAHFALTGARHEDAAFYYLIRLSSYALILWAIIEKNLPKRGAR